MNADEQRLTALKKAYADIILNTAKEAAARIMVSDRKALRFQHDLNVTRDQGVQTLLRLKQMMDFKVSEAEVTSLKKIEELTVQLREAEDIISEAEMTSLSQQRKIEELEAQLQEAEDIVKDLRDELREVQAELGRVRNIKLQHLDEQDTPGQEERSQQDRISIPETTVFSPSESCVHFADSDMKSSVFNQGIEVCKSGPGNDDFVSSYAGKTDLSSTSEEKKLTTRCALPPPAEQPEAAPDMKNPYFVWRNEAINGNDANHYHSGNSYASKPNLPAIILRSKVPEPPFRNRRTQRIRAFEEKIMAGELCFHDPLDDVNEEISERNNEEAEEICKTANRKANNKSNTDKKGVVRTRSSRKRKRAYKKTKTSLLKYLPDRTIKTDQAFDVADTQVNCVNNDLQSGENSTQVEPELLSGTTEMVKLIGCLEVTESDTEAKAGYLKNASNNDGILVNESLPTREENDSMNGPRLPACMMDLDKIDVPVVNSVEKPLDTIDGITDQLIANRVIKYTFQRKRKKESLSSSSDGNASLEMDIVKKMTAEKQSGPVEANSGSTNESSRNSSHLAQVARQLISLSEKKCWQEVFPCLHNDEKGC